MAKSLWSFGLSECNRVNLGLYCLYLTGITIQTFTVNMADKYMEVLSKDRVTGII